jgi:hypothetical protein
MVSLAENPLKFQRVIVAVKTAHNRYTAFALNLNNRSLWLNSLALGCNKLIAPLFALVSISKWSQLHGTLCMVLPRNGKQ